jgi:hypothetical protein
VLRAKSTERAAGSASTPAEDELAILKAKRGKPAARVDIERPDDVETLKAKLAGNVAKTKGETTTRTAAEAKSLERGAPPKTLPRKAAGMAPVRAKRNLPDAAADGPRLSAFDVAFVLVLGLWGIAFALALTTGAHWWLFVLCSVATAAALLFGLLDSTAFRPQRRQE